VLYESPHRIERLLGELAALFPDRHLVLARELTKKFEEFLRGRAAELAAATHGRGWRGELVVLVGPPEAEVGSEAGADDSDGPDPAGERDPV